ncbi:MAG: hypothetical protein ACTSR2_01540 [Candidatus Hodarchaeales archaeon]
MAVYDDLDFFILRKIYFSKPHITTWDIAKEFFKDIDLRTKEGLRELDSKHNMIKYRLRRMQKLGLIFISKNSNGKNEYVLIKDNVIFSKHKFPDGYKDAILIKENGKWMVFQL